MMKNILQKHKECIPGFIVWLVYLLIRVAVTIEIGVLTFIICYELAGDLTLPYQVEGFGLLMMVVIPFVIGTVGYHYVWKEM